MPRSKNDKVKTVAKRGTPLLPTGVKVVPAPKSAARRRLLSGPDIEVSGGCRTANTQPVGR
jgi:hypothetical protein